MGYDTRQLTITARVSRHNSEQDKFDDETWERLRHAIDELITDDYHLYREINVQITVP